MYRVFERKKRREELKAWLISRDRLLGWLSGERARFAAMARPMCATDE